MPTHTREIVLASRPKGMPDTSNFSIREESLPELKEGQVLVRTLYLSVDPYMRGRMNEGPSYVESFQINQPITGGAVGRIEETKHSGLQKGDIVSGFLNWADYSVVDGAQLQKVDPSLGPISTALGVLGMPGLTAYFGLLDIGQPKAGETVVVSGAAGAVGIIVGQIAKIQGCRVIGIAGSDDKCNFLVQELGFDAAVNYKNPSLFADLKYAAPQGVDVYFDNVGGPITDQVMRLINLHSRIAICGQISMYNLDKEDVGPRNFWILLVKRSLAQGFIVMDYVSRYEEGIKRISQWIKEGKIKYKESLVEGLDKTPEAFLGLFKGENIGKQIVKVAD